MNPSVTREELVIALRKAVLIMSRFAKTLNAQDRGRRANFADAEEWVEALRKDGKLKRNERATHKNK